MRTKTASTKDYKMLAKNALYGFACVEGRDCHSMMCELIPNTNLRLIEGKRISAKLLKNAIKTELLSIINSKRFTQSLQSYCNDESRQLNNSNTDV